MTIYIIIFLRVIALLILLRYVFPAQIQEIKTSRGKLKPLRVILFLIVIFVFISITVPLIYQTCRIAILHCTNIITVDLAGLFTSFANLLVSVFLACIYHYDKLFKRKKS